MPKYAFVNGRFVHHRDAFVHIEDRGYQFSDGVYEVIPIFNKKTIDADAHLDRLEYSLKQLKISLPTTRCVVEILIDELMLKNQLSDGLVYIQITRGVAPRNHAFPIGPIKPAFVMTTKQIDFAKSKIEFEKGVKIITSKDLRWARRDIKTISLLPNCLAKQEAVEQGAYEAWLIDQNGFITEGTSSNAWIITRDSKIITRKNDHDILNGITRTTIIKLAQESGLNIIIDSFTL
ncbi:MAG: aminotransferase class IV, partial [Pseudomonadota bacterium]